MMSCVRFLKDLENSRKVITSSFSSRVKIKVSRVVVFSPPDRETRKPRGFTFVKFCNPEDAESAIKAMDGTVKFYLLQHFYILPSTGFQRLKTKSRTQPVP